MTELKQSAEFVRLYFQAFVSMIMQGAKIPRIGIRELYTWVLAQSIYGEHIAKETSEKILKMTARIEAIENKTKFSRTISAPNPTLIPPLYTTPRMNPQQNRPSEKYCYNEYVIQQVLYALCYTNFPLVAFTHYISHMCIGT
eukprot:GHVQ01038689.1.p1 GENE.GHVQ01038689.1~~GHVQ01038689.1.p1  ORF type:complete len:142 (-),score=1.80 GHVQ01038689.1:1083-1508(-)